MLHAPHIDTPLSLVSNSQFASTKIWDSTHWQTVGAIGRQNIDIFWSPLKNSDSLNSVDNTNRRSIERGEELISYSIYSRRGSTSSYCPDSASLELEIMKHWNVQLFFKSPTCFPWQTSSILLFTMHTSLTEPQNQSFKQRKYVF